MIGGTLDTYLEKPADYEKINKISQSVFYQGNLDEIDDLFLEILPIVNVTYHKYIKTHDDRGSAYEDLLQDAILELYRDLTLRWDKFIDVEDHYNYFKTVCKNVMTGLVFEHHNHYIVDEIDDLESITSNELPMSYENSYSAMIARSTKEYYEKNFIPTIRNLAAKRRNYAKVLNYLITWRYVEGNSDITKLKGVMKVFGVNRTQINFLLDHIEYLYKLVYNYFKAEESDKVAVRDNLSKVMSRFDDKAYEIIATNYSDTILPEIYAEFGADIAKKFVKLFSGKQINVPDYKAFSEDLIGGIVLSVSGGSKENLYKISQKYSLPYGTLAKSFDRVEKFNRSHEEGR